MPRLLLSGVDTSLKPKFKFLEELGFSRRDIVRLVIKGPVILSLSLENHLRPSVDFLRTQLGSDLDLPKAIKKSWRLLSMNLHKTGLPHIELLRSHGVDDKQIQKLFLLEPYLFLVNVTVLENLISRIEMLNAKFLPGMLIYALHSLRRVSVERFEAKCKLWKSFGLSDEDIVSAFEKFPSFVTISEEKFRCLMDFLVNDVGFEPKQIAANTFGMSLAKRIRPRCWEERVLMSTVLKLESAHYSFPSQVIDVLKLARTKSGSTKGNELSLNQHCINLESLNN
ncbi:hypothetical protein H6P81_011136 [Aristolochia fimbriata]|uniref:Uncharacterized protein n=1 Tax=Aristolochia fimbriata TaxID=158543 RepID=A0AAV7EU56_ARIFI|nr:hypothetical protein H6P81_011136 [Aristolochia fimbriata]